MTNPEAFALHMRSMFMDAINNETGLLRCLAENLDPEGGLGHLKPLADHLRGMADELQKKLSRVNGDIEEFVGGEPRLHELYKEDFDAGLKLSAYQWLADDNPRKKHLRTCRTCTHASDGFCNSEILNEDVCEQWRGHY